MSKNYKDNIRIIKNEIAKYTQKYNVPPKVVKIHWRLISTKPISHGKRVLIDEIELYIDDFLAVNEFSIRKGIDYVLYNVKDQKSINKYFDYGIQEKPKNTKYQIKNTRNINHSCFYRNLFWFVGGFLLQSVLVLIYL